MKKAILICLLSLSPAASVRGAGVLDMLPFFALSGDYIVRRGYLDFGNHKVQEVRRSDVATAGVQLGKRWLLGRNMRIQLAGSIKYGSVTDDTLPPIVLDNGASQATLLHLRLFHGGILADFQYPFVTGSDCALFLHGGVGGHIAKTEESETLLNNPNQPVLDDYLEDNLMYSGSIHGGGGFEIAVSPEFGFAVTYSVRYWHPIHYSMSRDLFPYKSIDYHERFFSHELDLLFLFKKY